MTTHNINFDRLMEVARHYAEAHESEMRWTEQCLQWDMPFAKCELDREIIHDDSIGCCWSVFVTKTDYFGREDYSVDVYDSDTGESIVEFNYEIKD